MSNLEQKERNKMKKIAIAIVASLAVFGASIPVATTANAVVTVEKKKKKKKVTASKPAPTYSCDVSNVRFFDVFGWSKETFVAFDVTNTGNTPSHSQFELRSLNGNLILDDDSSFNNYVPANSTRTFVVSMYGSDETRPTTSLEIIEDGCVPVTPVFEQTIEGTVVADRYNRDLTAIFTNTSPVTLDLWGECVFRDIAGNVIGGDTSTGGTSDPIEPGYSVELSCDLPDNAASGYFHLQQDLDLI